MRRRRGPGRPSVLPEVRLWSRIKRGPNGCWLWTGSTVNGFGMMNVDGFSVYTHRLAYELSIGEPLPLRMQIRHTCHQRLCCNPEHLRLKSQR